MTEHKELELKELAIDLYNIEALKFGEFETKIGLQTPIYFDLRIIISYPDIMSKLAKTLWKLDTDSMDLDKISQICGVPYTALPLATLISVENHIPMLMKRKEAKSYGTKKLIEGKFSPGDNCIIIEDVITSGSSILETTNTLRKEGLKVTKAYVVIDRQQGGKKNLEDHGIKVTSLYTITQLMEYLLDAGKITSEITKNVYAYLLLNQAPSIDSLNLSENRLKLSFAERAKLCNNSLASELLEIMEIKKTNICLALDLTTTKAILGIAHIAGPHIAVLKIHVDILEDFNEDFIKLLHELSSSHQFLIMEDRKFSDIGNTVSLQCKGIYKIAQWADLITMHAMPGSSVLDVLGNTFKSIKKSCGVFLVAEMSCTGHLFNNDYVSQAVSMAENSDLVAGLVCQSNIFSKPGLIQMTPGVNLNVKTDDLGQQYNDPETVIASGADLAVVGRAITEKCDKVGELKKYKELLWAAYKTRIA